jgi:uncharacterized membrane protein
MTGELMGLSVAALGLWYWLARRKGLPGVLIACAGLAWSAFAVKVVVPAIRGGESSFYGLYESIGGSPEGIVRTVFTDPGAIVRALTETNDVEYILWLAAPVAGMFLLAPGLAAVALPQLLANGLADPSAPVDSRAHYVAAIIPFLLAATVLGIARIPRTGRVRAAAVVLVLSAVVSILAGPWPGTPAPGVHTSRESRSAGRNETLGLAVALVPRDAAVSATNVLGSHLSARRYFFQVPVLRRADWIVVDMEDDTQAVIPIAGYRGASVLLRGFVKKIGASPEWRRVLDRDGIVVFRKVSKS